MKKLVVVSAGVSDPSTTRMLAGNIAEAVEAQVSKRGEGLDIEYIELRELATSLGTVMSTGLYDAPLREALDKVSAADGLIAATPVFAASYSGLFKMFFDALDKDALTSMPVIVAATAGTARHSLVTEYAMRPLFSYLRATVMPTAVFAATDDFGADVAGEEMHRRSVRAARELAEYLVDVRSAVVGFGPDFGDGAGGSGSAGSGNPNHRRSTNTQVNPNVTDFASLLSGHDGTL
nr:FMN reductase [Corynebacterium lactis]